MKKAMAWLLVISILGIPASLWAKERQGAEIIVVHKDGSDVTGELIAVRQRSLLLVDWEKGKDVSVDFVDVRAVAVVQKSKTLQGMRLGLVIGGGLGAVCGLGGAAREGDSLDGYFAVVTTPSARGATASSLAGSTGALRVSPLGIGGRPLCSCVGRDSGPHGRRRPVPVTPPPASFRSSDARFPRAICL